MSPIELLEYGKDNQVPAADLLRQLGFFTDPYQRFLIEVIWFGAYGAAGQVLSDLKRAQELNNIWALLEFSSDLPWEKQLGLDNLKSSDLKFIDQYIWWRYEFNAQNEG